MPTAIENLQNTTNAALKDFNNAQGKSWTWGMNWTNKDTMFDTFVNQFLFPKLDETILIQTALGNRFDWLAKEKDFIGQYSEEYVILDTVPVNMNLSKNEELMLKRNYPKMATKLYSQGILKKTKFTLNNNDTRLNFSTLKDATAYALGVYRKRLSDINYTEELEIKGMLVDYGLKQTKEKRTVSTKEALFTSVFEAILNIQNNSSKYNEATTASGGEIGRYTTISSLENVLILTNDSMKTFLLDTKLANTFQVAGLDLSKKIMSFDDLGGIYKMTADVTIAETATITKFRQMGDYQIDVGDIVPKDSVITYDVSALTEFVGKIEEIKPPSDLFAYIFDANKIRYTRNTKDMLKKPFFNGEFDEVTYWIHYYSFKSMSPFYNSVLVTGEA